jgi:hypothetical protein
MLLNGVWYLCDDGIVRPVIHGEIQKADGSWMPAFFLMDTAADRTAFSADVLAALGLQLLAPPHELGGVGGVADTVVVEAQIQFARENGGKAVFRGHFAAFTELEALDMSVLGRDITNLFALIVDRPRDVACLLGQRHQYIIVER